MECPHCHTTNPRVAESCTKCGAELRDGSATLVENTTGEDSSESWAVHVAGELDSAAGQNLAPGVVFANRYHILQLLGEGGMGAVYKAKDTAVDRVVALKVIRAELAAQPEILRRFKQELLLARQVTHKNVIRIYELGEVAGTRFITMEYIEGRTLAAFTGERGKLGGEDAVKVMEQVFRALEAAHAEGVVHRDLKPQNIMMDVQGRAYVMDFGIARSAGNDNMTRTGAILGTPDYMSPEQVLGRHVDGRSDIYSAGIIFYQLLTGVKPFQAETVVALMLQRTSTLPRAVNEIDPMIPEALSDVISKCLQVDLERRYQSAPEVLTDLQAWRGGTAVERVVLPAPRLQTPRHKSTRLIVLAVAAALALASVATVFRHRIIRTAKPAEGAPTALFSLAILPFQNSSGDKTLDWLAPLSTEMLRSNLGQSPHFHQLSSDRVRQVLNSVGLTAADASARPNLQRFAATSNADAVLSGTYHRDGERIRFEATLENLKQSRSETIKAEVANEAQILAATNDLSASIRQKLSAPSAILKEAAEQSLRPSSTSLASLRAYYEGVQFARQGMNSQAAKQLETAIKEDPQFALAYSQLARVYANTGEQKEAEQYSRRSQELSANLPEREKLLIQARYDEILNNYDQANTEYEHLVKISPDDADVQFELAHMQESLGAYDKSRESLAKVLTLDPARVDALLATGRVEIEAGNVPGAFDVLTRANSLAIEFSDEEELAKILQAFGVAYFSVNRLQEALQSYQNSLAIKRRLGLKKGVADSLQAIAQTENGLGKTTEALKDYQEALRIRRDMGDNAGTGDAEIDLALFYSEHGKYSDAMKLYKDSLSIQNSVRNENNRGLVLNNIGITYLQQGDYMNAQTYLEQALAVREKLNVPSDIADTLHNIAEASARNARYDQALAQYMRALELRRNADDKHGTALEFCSLGALFGYQGRFGAALSSEQNAVQILREKQEQGFYMTEALNEYGKAQAQIGQSDAARKTLKEALEQARTSGNQTQIAQALSNLGDNALYTGDLRSASSFYQEAQSVALQAKDREVLLLVKAKIAILSETQNPSASKASELQRLAAEADSLGLKYLSVECSLHQTTTLIQAKQYSQAIEDLLHTLGRSEKLGLRSLSAQCHYLLSRAYQGAEKSKDAEAHRTEALRILQEISKEAGSDTVLSRKDFALISASPGAAVTH